MPARYIWLGLICALLQSQPAAAGEPAADFLTKLFLEVCVPNMGRPDKVRAWANERRLGPVTNPASVSVFVGPGDKGGAWALPAGVGNFAVAIRGQTEACTVWAQSASPGDVEINFKKLMEGVNRPGLKMKVERDATAPTPVGQARPLVYSLFANDARQGFAFTMLTAERSGGPFQATLQVSKATMP